MNKRKLVLLLCLIPFLSNAQVTPVTNAGADIGEPSNTLTKLQLLGNNVSIWLNAQQNNVPYINFKNDNGFWHFSGPRSNETNSPLSVFWNAGSYNRYFSIANNGHVGIGNMLPEHQLDVVADNPTFRIKSTSNNREIKIKPSAGIIEGENTTLSLNRVSDKNVSMVYGGGNVGIGVLNATSKLEVDGKIRSEEIKVEIINGADFVFSDNYRLGSLAALEHYIKANKHLPEIASEKKMQENGLEVGKFQIQLLQKIEELTLYVIELKKEINKLQQKVTTLER